MNLRDQLRYQRTRDIGKKDEIDTVLLKYGPIDRREPRFLSQTNLINPRVLFATAATEIGPTLAIPATPAQSTQESQSGLLAELADAVDSKSTGASEKPPINAVFREKPDGCLSNACPPFIPDDPELAKVIAAWPKLPADVKSVVLRLVKD